MPRPLRSDELFAGLAFRDSADVARAALMLPAAPAAPAHDPEDGDAHTEGCRGSCGIVRCTWCAPHACEVCGCELCTRHAYEVRDGLASDGSYVPTGRYRCGSCR